MSSKPRPRLKVVYESMSPAMRLWDLKRQFITLKRFSKADSELIDANSGNLSIASNGSVAVIGGTQTLLTYTNPLTQRETRALTKVKLTNGSAISSNGKWLLHKVQVGTTSTEYAKEVFVVQARSSTISELSAALQTDLLVATPTQILDSIFAGAVIPANGQFVYGVKPPLTSIGNNDYGVLPFSADKWSRYDAIVYMLSYVPFHRVEFKRMTKVDNGAVSMFYQPGNLDSLVSCTPGKIAGAWDAVNDTYCGLVRDPRCECMDTTACMTSYVGSANGNRALYCSNPQAWKTSAAVCPCLSDNCKLFQSEDTDRKTSFLYDQRYDNRGVSLCPSTLEIAICQTAITAGGNVNNEGGISVKQQCGAAAATYVCDTVNHVCREDNTGVMMKTQCDTECTGGFICDSAAKTCAWSKTATATVEQCNVTCAPSPQEPTTTVTGGYTCDSAKKCTWSDAATDTLAACEAKCTGGGDAPPLSVGAIAGIASGGLVALILIVVLIYVFVIKKNAAAVVGTAQISK